jgi:chemotaxis protein MotA
VAFVATVYGIFLANILFLPAANKLKARLQNALLMKELALEGVEAIVEGMNPVLIEQKLESYRRPIGEAVGTKQGREARESRKSSVRSAA